MNLVFQDYSNLGRSSMTHERYASELDELTYQEVKCRQLKLDASDSVNGGPSIRFCLNSSVTGSFFDMIMP